MSRMRHRSIHCLLSGTSHSPLNKIDQPIIETALFKSCTLKLHYLTGSIKEIMLHVCIQNPPKQPRCYIGTLHTNDYLNDSFFPVFLIKQCKGHPRAFFIYPLNRLTEKNYVVEYFFEIIISLYLDFSSSGIGESSDCCLHKKNIL